MKTLQLEKINKHSVLKQVRTNKKWEGYIAPNNTNSFHIVGGWHLGMSILITVDRNNEYYVVSNNAQDYKPLETYLSSYAYYNCNSELGQRIRFWEE